MKKIAKRFLLSIVPKSLLRLAIFLSLSGSVRAQVQAAQLIEVTAKKYEYSNSPFHANMGTKVGEGSRTMQKVIIETSLSLLLILSVATGSGSLEH